MLPHLVLITGGAGFLGSHLVEQFCRHGARVRLFDVAARPDWAQGPAIEYLRGDVRDERLTQDALDGVDTVIHAAFASPRQNRELIRSVNREGTRILCGQAAARRVGRFILISSTIVMRSPKVHPFLPNSPLTRLDAYRSARAEAEKIASDCGRSAMPVAIVRPKTFIGPGCLSAFAILFEWVRLGKPVPILGDGEIRYQLVDVRDMAEGIRLLGSCGAAGIFYFGGRRLPFRTPGSPGAHRSCADRLSIVHGVKKARAGGAARHRVGKHDSVVRMALQECVRRGFRRRYFPGHARIGLAAQV